MTEFFIGDLRTGRRLMSLPITSGSWSVGLNGPGSLSVSLTLLDPDVAALDLRSAATVGKSYLAAAEGDVILEAGPIWTHSYSKDTGKLTLNGGGLWTYFDHRVLIPILAAGESPQGADSEYVGISLGTIAKRLVQQAQAHTGGNVPVVFAPDEAGTAEQVYKGADLKLVGDALNDLTQLEGGPEIEFLPQWSEDRLSVRWLLRTGTNSNPQLASTATHVWDYSVSQPSIKGLEVNIDGSAIAGRAWATGGRSSSAALYGVYTNTALTNQGYPLLEVVDSAHATDDTDELVQGYATELARVGSKPTEFWSFSVRADELPTLGQYRPGDFCEIRMANDPYVPDGKYRRRIVDMSGDQDGKWVKVTTGEVYSLTG